MIFTHGYIFNLKTQHWSGFVANHFHQKERHFCVEPVGQILSNLRKSTQTQGECAVKWQAGELNLKLPAKMWDTIISTLRGIAPLCSHLGNAIRQLFCLSKWVGRVVVSLSMVTGHKNCMNEENHLVYYLSKYLPFILRLNPDWWDTISLLNEHLIKQGLMSFKIFFDIH